MRFKSSSENGYNIYAVSGVNTVSFAVDSENADTSGLLGFSVERFDKKENERYFMRNVKVFEELVPAPGEGMDVSSFEHPVQSLVWDDFTAKPGYEYTYYFYPVKGKPKNLSREAPIEINVKTEPLFSSEEHDIFFNRGVASSQAYAKKFFNLSPDKLKGKKKEEAYQWLSRELDEAILKFIAQAEAGDTLLGCFYEFRYLPVVKAFKEAVTKGVNVKIIIDAKENEYKDKDGKLHKSFPRLDNLKMIKDAKIPLKNIILRESNKSYIQHNKFIIYIKGDSQTPVSVWTGSTNISEGGLFGQANVGHWIHNEKTAEKYKLYWELLSIDPGTKTGSTKPGVKMSNKEYKKEVMKIQDDLNPDKLDEIPAGITPIFSPRAGAKILQTYAEMVDKAGESAFITLAFGVNKVFKELLKDNTAEDNIIFMLLEKKDKPNPKSKEKFIKLGAGNNVYQAWGSYIKDSLYQWTKETNAKILKINNHVSYIHSKFLIKDPLSKDPVIVTGSANFSENSTVSNDENMVVIRGNLRAADIYLTEFNRLFFHYYYRSVLEDLSNNPTKKSKTNKKNNKSIFLQADDSWLGNYAKGKLRYKRVKMFSSMQGIVEC